jgi:hypothetical protein
MEGVLYAEDSLNVSRRLLIVDSEDTRAKRIDDVPLSDKRPQ